MARRIAFKAPYTDSKGNEKMSTVPTLRKALRGLKYLPYVIAGAGIALMAIQMYRDFKDPLEGRIERWEAKEFQTCGEMSGIPDATNALENAKKRGDREAAEKIEKSLNFMWSYRYGGERDFDCKGVSASRPSR